MYKIYKDKNEVFEASIEVEGGSINETKCRLILESDNINLMFPGEITSDGKIKAPIQKLKNLLKEGETGKLTLEVIVEDTWFTPWEDNFEIALSKKVMAEVKQPQPEKKNKGISIKVSAPKRVSLEEVKKQFIEELIENDVIDMKSAMKNKKLISEIVERYSQEHDISNPNKFVKDSLHLIIK